MFIWHFTLRGPPKSDYENGLYHGVVELNESYPFKPPKISFLTPSGRFEVGKDICMSFTNYHPESWQPAWTSKLKNHNNNFNNLVSNILHGIVSYMPIDEEEI